MGWIRFLLGAAALAFATFPLAAQHNSENPRDYGAWTPEQWHEAARLDIMAAYQQFVENHPGMFDLANPGFSAQLVEAREAGLAEAAKAYDNAGYAQAMGAFSGVMSDGHAKISGPRPSVGADTRDKWPGFVALWRGNGLQVFAPDRSNPLAGASIEGCDGKGIEEFLGSSLAPIGFRANEAGQWWFKASLPFYGPGIAGKNLPAECTFVFPEGRRETRKLDWTYADEKAADLLLKLVYPQALPIGLHEPRKGIFVIGLGNFAPDDQQRASYDRLYAELAKRREELLSARAVVLDMRGNNGGSSVWSQTVAELLWGKDAFASRDVPIEGIDWRASPDTISYVTSMSLMFRKQGQDELADWVLDLSNKLVDAREKGLPLYREPDDSDGMVSAKVASDFSAPVYVINWGGCASACLDANDYFKRFDNTRLIGAPTSADSTYMEVRQVQLPNGPASVVIPNKTWVGRQRGWGEVYQPDIAMAQADWSTEAFLDRIERDLAD